MNVSCTGGSSSKSTIFWCFMLASKDCPVRLVASYGVCPGTRCAGELPELFSMTFLVRADSLGKVRRSSQLHRNACYGSLGPSSPSRCRLDAHLRPTGTPLVLLSSSLQNRVLEVGCSASLCCELLARSPALSVHQIGMIQERFKASAMG